ncbi:MAG TPA: hypothetical protein DCY00_07455 [Actinobacteria bacterium]|nr:hypothetical protein [Actinomycetota bacterium]
MVKFTFDAHEGVLINEISTRALKSKNIYGSIDKLTLEMDISAAHSNGCRLDLEKLLKAPDADFFHDIVGICNNIDRNTGKLGNLFLPRCALNNHKEK